MSQIVDRHSPSGQPDKKAMLGRIYSPVVTELKEVESILHRELASDTPWVDELLKHSRLVGGKRMRPVFLLLAGGSCGEISDAHLNLAAAVEMIHTATLIHDDVLDRAETRRHVPTANFQWGNKVSVLLGDYLFTHAFHVASLSGSVEAIKMMSSASNRVCSGEMRQNDWVGDVELSEADYLTMIEDKTGQLCGCACRIGAFLSGADAETVLGFDRFGKNLGTAFQIIDDVLDLVGDQDAVGKTLGTDVANQKLTLPLIHCLGQLDGAQRLELQKHLSGDAQVETVLKFLASTNSIEYAKGVAETQIKRSLDFVTTLPETEYRNSLVQATEFVLQRSH